MKTDITKWKALPLELAGHFNDTHEWVLVQVMWFKSNLKGYKFNISNLCAESPIKSRKTILRVLNRLVEKGWVDKTPLGKSNKYHRYSLNKDCFMKWIEKVSNDTSTKCQMTPKMVSNDTKDWCQMTPKMVSNDTVQIRKEKNVQNSTRKKCTSVQCLPVPSAVAEAFLKEKAKLDLALKEKRLENPLYKSMLNAIEKNFGLEKATRL